MGKWLIQISKIHSNLKYTMIFFKNNYDYPYKLVLGVLESKQSVFRVEMCSTKSMVTKRTKLLKDLQVNL